MTIQTPVGNKLNGFFRGKVIKHLKHGKCKVWIPSIYDPEWETQPDMLPDAEQAAPLFAGSNHGNGCFSYPNIGAIVWCFFQNGDQNYPVIFASTLGGELATAQYKEARPYVNEETISSGDDAYVHKINTRHSYIKMWENGRIEIVAYDNDTQSNYCKIEFDGTGNLVMSSSQQIQINTNTLKINAGTQIELNTPNYTCINSVTNNIIAPSINLDARSANGMICLNGATETQMIV